MKSCHLLKNKTKNILFISFLVTLIVSLLCSTTGIAKADSGTTLKALEDDANGYKPTQIVNGDFSEMPWMDFVYDGTTYTKETAGPSTVLPTTNYTVSTIYNEKGWNTSETSAWKDSVFEYIVGSVAEDDYYSYDMASARKKDNIQYAYNKGLLTEFQNGTNKGCVELNASSSAIFYQDLTTYSNDVIRWSLKHATRNENGKGDTPATQTMYVEIGATPFNASGNVIPASGINSSKDTKIVSGLATYTSTGVSGTNGYANTSDLQYLALTRPTNYDDTDQKQGDKWYDVTGVYVVPSGQTTTRFAFVSNDTGSKGNLMDDVEFSTLIGNVHAQLVSNGDLVITGYWGETDTSKHLNIKFGSTVKQIDMSSVCGQNFILTLSGSTYGSLYNGISTVDIYHEDYSSAKTTIKINHVHDWNYDVSGNKLSISCKNTTGACDFKDLGVSSVSVSINAENKEYDGTAYSLASISGDIDNWLRTGQYLPSIYYEGKGDTSYTLSKTAPTNAGTYYAKISSDEKSYASTTFTITQKEVELEWGTNSFTYNGSEQKPTATVKSTSLCGSDSCSVTVTGGQTNVGSSYTATASSLSNGNYKLPSSKTKTFSISQKAITITASAQTIGFSESISSGTSNVVVDTLCTGDSLNSITLTPSGSSVTTSGTITPSGAVIKNGTTDVTSNYSITYNTGNLTITVKSITDGDSNLVITLSASSSVYTGSEIKPTITGITYNSTALTTSDYQISSYENNKNVGTSAKVNITLKGNYSGSVSTTFSITQKEVELEWSNLTFTYDGSAHKPTASVKATSLCGTDTCSVTVSGEQTNVGSSYTATASGLGNSNYKLPSSNTNTFSITAKSITDGDDKLVITLSADSSTYTGSEITPTISGITYNSVALTTSDYEISSYENNVNVGTSAKVNLTLKGNYTGCVSTTFSITQKAITITASAQTISYGECITSTTSDVVVDTLGTGDSLSSITLTPSGSALTTSGTITPSGAVIKKGTTDVTSNYSITYDTGVLTINEKEIEDGDDNLVITLSADSATYTGSEITPTITGITYNSVALTTSDYEISSYENNINVGTSAKVNVTLKGNYTGSVSTTFSITVKAITITASAQTISYGECITSTTSDVVVDTLCDGDLLSSITLTPSGSALTTNGTITPSGAIIKKGTVDVTSNYAITYDTGVLTINEKEIEDGDDNLVITLSADSSVYTGSEITPTITGITYNSVALTTSDYEISSYENNVNVGTSAKVNVTLKGNYTGSVSTTFSITQKEITITASAQTITFGTSITSTASDVVVETFGTGDSVDSITLTPSGSDVTTNGTITPSGAVIKKGDVDVTSNYSITYDTGVLTINAKEIEDDDDDLVITLSADSATYTGSEITPTITGITYNSVALTTSDYEISGYENNIYVGTSAKVNVTLKGNYTGSVSTTFSITQKAITITANAQTIDYGSSISSLASDVVVETLGTGDSLNSITLTPSGSSATTSGTITPSGAVIKKGTTDVTSNYSITYDTGLLVINGKRLDDVLLELEEKPDPLNDDDIIEELIVKDGDNKLEKDKDYEEKIVRNEETGENEIVITPKGDYTGDDIIKPLFEYDMSSITYTDVKVAYDELGHNIAIQGTLPKKVQVHYGDDKIEAGIYTMTASFTTTSIYHKAPSSMTAKLTIKSTVLDNGNKGDEKPTVLVSFPDGFDPSIHISADLKLRQELNKSVKDLEKNYGPFYLTYGAYSVTLYRYVTIDDVVTVEEVQPGDIAEGTILTLRMVFPTELKGKNFKLLHIHSDDDINEIVQSDELKVGTYIIDEEGYIVTMIDRLSEFALIYEGVCFAHWFMLGATILDILFILVTLIFIKKNAKISGLVCASWFAVINIIACIFAHCTFCWILIGFNSALLIGTIIFALLYKGENDNDDGSKSKDDEEKKSGENTGSTAKDKIVNAGKIFIGKCKQIASTVKDKSVNAGKFLIGKCKQATNTVKDKFTKTSDDKNEVAKNQTTNDSSDSNETENKNSGETVKLANYEEAGKNDNDSEAEKEKLSLKESVAKAQETKAEISLNKEGIAKWLKEEYGENVTLNTRGNQTKTGLPLADTHYMEIDGKQKCFIYVYDVDGKSFAIVRGNEKVAKEISAKGHKIMPSAFPKTRDGGKWYTLLIDDSYKSSEEFCNSLRAIVSNLSGNKLTSATDTKEEVPVINVEEEEEKELEDLCKSLSVKEEIPISYEGENGVEVVGVCFLKKKKVYKFSPNGKVFNEGQKVVVDTVNGQMVGMIVFGNYFVDPNSLVAELKNVIDVIE